MALDFNQLAQFTGTNEWHRHSLMKSITYTDGVKYVADEAGAYWFIDIIGSMQLMPDVHKEEFQAWVLEVSGTVGVVRMDDGNGVVIYTQTIEFTDFPEPGITFWFTDNVILLPSEY